MSNITAKQIMAESQEFKQGTAAHGQGLNIDTCPYIENSMSKRVRIARREWRSGWHDAQQSALKAW